jgi:hypothetical protein
VLPSLVTDADTFYPPVILVPTQTLVPQLVAADDAFFNTSIFGDAPGHGLQRLRPARDQRRRDHLAAAIGASVKPSLVAADDLVIPAASISAARGPALVTDIDAVYAFTTTRFVQPGFVSDADTIAAADVGWQVIAEFTSDADEHFPYRWDAYNDVLPNVWLDEENVEGYPFFIQGHRRRHPGASHPASPAASGRRSTVPALPDARSP